MRRNIVAVLLAVLAAAPVFGQQNRNHNFEITKNLDIFNAIYKNLDLSYVDTLNADTMVRVAVKSMLGLLDPFTSYYSEKEARAFQNETRGKFAGIGSNIGYYEKEKRVRLTGPRAGGPAEEAGMRAGDVILSVDGKDIEGMQISEVQNLLLGEPDTPVQITVKRPGANKPLTFNLMRRTIEIPNVPYSGMVADGVGYIYLESVLDGSAKEVKRALVELKKQGAKKLVLDLRGNGGGLLNESVDIVNLFVPKGKDIVEQRGKIKSANYKYITQSEPADPDIPLAVLVDGGTASAAEIISGSLQDLDRAIIIGTRTYGKGLVQEPREMPYDGMLKLTIGKYYIPSGRCVQAYKYDHSSKGRYYGTRVPDSLTHVFKTAAGREVRDGGGITPDIVTQPDSLGNNLLYYLLKYGLPFDYACQYAAKHKSIAPPETFAITDGDYAEFVDFVKSSKFAYNYESSKETLEELEKIARAEGCYNGAQEEFKALAAKFQPNLEGDLNLYKKNVADLVNNEIAEMYYHEQGAIRQRLADDDNMKAALGVLADSGKYSKILSAKP